MKKLLLALALVATVVGGIFVMKPAYAAECQTNILPDSLCDKSATETGQGIKDLLSIIIDIMTAVVGILGVVGVTVVGIQYLTSSGDTAKATKAKRRLLEIVIGVAAFVLIGVLIKFLVPSAQ